jgi:uncharacterized protein YcaQ
VSPEDAKGWCAAALTRGEIDEVLVEAADGSLRRSYCLTDLTRRAETAPPPPERVRILSPFDPALRDRNRAERLFGFRYRIEVFVPAPKRTYGYYVFPVLEGARLIGRIDLKCRRDLGALAVAAFWPEAGVQMGKGRTARLMAELDRLGRFTGCPELILAPDWMRESDPFSGRG